LYLGSDTIQDCKSFFYFSKNKKKNTSIFSCSINNSYLFIFYFKKQKTTTTIALTTGIIQVLPIAIMEDPFSLAVQMVKKIINMTGNN